MALFLRKESIQEGRNITVLSINQSKIIFLQNIKNKVEDDLCLQKNEILKLNIQGGKKVELQTSFLSVEIWAPLD
jgi:hypothetical protein